MTYVSLFMLLSTYKTQHDIEQGFYSRGAQEELVAKIKQLDPNAGIIWGSIDRLEKQLEKLEAEKEKRDKQLDSLVQQANDKLRK